MIYPIWLLCREYNENGLDTKESELMMGCKS
jgi:hypothetical protein